jgi:hypothetical protein
MQAANAYNPLASTISGLSNNQQFTSGLANWFTGAPTRYNNPITAWYSGTTGMGD